jgi:ribosomal protein S18 acetylase RimI-like enzyme
MFSRYRKLFLKQYERHEKGENVILVAELNGFPIGRLWVDLEKRRQDSTGVLWAFAVLPPLQNLGIGTRLMTAAEGVLRSQGFRIAEIGAEKDNPGARRLYERLGYRVIGDNLEEWDVTTPEGKVIHEVADEWILQKVLAEDATA